MSQNQNSIRYIPPSSCGYCVVSKRTKSVLYVLSILVVIVDIMVLIEYYTSPHGSKSYLCSRLNKTIMAYGSIFGIVSTLSLFFVFIRSFVDSYMKGVIDYPVIALNQLLDVCCFVISIIGFVNYANSLDECETSDGLMILILFWCLLRFLKSIIGGIVFRINWNHELNQKVFNNYRGSQPHVEEHVHDHQGWYA
eukprot:111675_1